MCFCCCCGDICMRWNNMIWYDGCVYISSCHALCIVSCHFMSWYFRTCERCSAILNPTLSFHPRLSHHKHIHYRNQSHVLLSYWKVENKLSLWVVQCTSLLLVCGTVWTDSCIKCFVDACHCNLLWTRPVDILWRYIVMKEESGGRRYEDIDTGSERERKKGGRWNEGRMKGWVGRA